MKKSSSTVFKPATSMISRCFYVWAEKCYDHALWVISLCVLLIAALMSQLSSLSMDLSTEAMLHKDDPVRVNYKHFKNEFGREDVIMLSIPTQGGLPDSLLSDIFALQQTLENEVPYVNKVTSLINARYSYGSDDELFTEDLLEDFPQHRWKDAENNVQGNRRLLDYVLAQPEYVNRLISADGEHTALMIELMAFTTEQNPHANDGAIKKLALTEAQSSEAVNAIAAIIAQYPQYDIALGGQPVLLSTIAMLVQRDSIVTFSSGLIAILLLMAFFFRRLSGVLLPFLVINGSVVTAIGFMAVIGSPVTLTTTAVYPLMMAVGVADSVHILAHFYRNLEKMGDKRQAIVEAIAYSAPAVLLTSVTTAIGFLSFTSGQLASTAEMGISAAMAVLAALFFTVVLLPSLIALFSIKQQAHHQATWHIVDKSLSACATLSCKYPRFISVAGLSIMALCLYGCSFLTFYDSPIENFADDVQAKIDNKRIDKAYAGNIYLEVIIDTGRTQGILEEDFIDQFQLAAQELSNTTIADMAMGNSYSVLNILKETHKALNDNQPAFYRVADDRALLAQELLLFEMNDADDLYDVVNEDLSKVRLSLKTRHDDGVKHEKLLRALEQRLTRIFSNNATVVITGASAMAAESVPLALKTMANSYVLAAAMIVIMMMIMVRSVGIGMISMVPNLLPILLVMNFMVLMDWPLDMTTILVGSIAMGIVVDDTLHFLYHFKQNFTATACAKKAVHQTLKGVGPALLITTVIFSVSIGCNMLSSIDNIFVFGLTLWMVTVLALLADVIVTPALLVWVYGKKSK